ncbi:MAG: dTDP-4-dehydrorhamnose 3,5-epimerase [Planctomycetaceae bacterium]|nr:MAG: dTDP-4-dehydrorhamnose 3,5-epimerase [Planctomycetaceae bacterium]
MKFIPTRLSGCFVIEPTVFGDDRGFFFETFHRRKFAEAGIDIEFVQDNHSRSRQNVVRGLHYQFHFPQGKLVRAVNGEIFDVAVDLRRGSPTRGQWYGAVLSESNRRQMYIPPGFAHGFCVTSESADVLYKCTEVYHPEDERTIAWNDAVLSIAWPLAGEAIISAKDQQGRPLAEAELYETTPVA